MLCYSARLPRRVAKTVCLLFATHRIVDFFMSYLRLEDQHSGGLFGGLALIAVKSPVLCGLRNLAVTLWNLHTEWWGLGGSRVIYCYLRVHDSGS